METHSYQACRVNLNKCLTDLNQIEIWDDDNSNRLVNKLGLMECLLALLFDKSYPNLPFQKQRLETVEFKAYLLLTVC